MQKPTRSLPAPRLVTAALSSLMLMSVILGGLTVAAAGVAGAAPQVQAKPGDTTTTLPEDRRVLGHSITRPNEGMEPQDAGDPGGWLQSSLFFLICGAVILMACAVWYQSRNARAKRSAAGMDPVAVAKATGAGVRAPSPLDKRADTSGS